jgi:hypothetical protein
LEREIPDPHVRQRECVPLQCRRPLEEPAETKKARHRRCFKPPSEKARRPQARANLGKPADMCFGALTQEKTSVRPRFAEESSVVIGALSDAKRGSEEHGKKRGAAAAAPPIAPRSAIVEFWFNPRALEGACRRLLYSSPLRESSSSHCRESIFGFCARPATLRDSARRLASRNRSGRAAIPGFECPNRQAKRTRSMIHARPAGERNGDESASLWIFRACSHRIWEASRQKTPDLEGSPEPQSRPLAAIVNEAVRK